MNATGFWKFIFFLILTCVIGVSVFVDFFIKFCIILVFFWCLSCFCLWLVLLAQVVWFIVVFCFVVMFVFYGGVIKCLIFLLAISTVSINDFRFCNFFCNFYDIFYKFFVFYNKKTPNFFGANLFYGVFHFDVLYSIFIEWFGSCYESQFFIKLLGVGLCFDVYWLCVKNIARKFYCCFHY